MHLIDTLKMRNLKLNNLRLTNQYVPILLIGLLGFLIGVMLLFVSSLHTETLPVDAQADAVLVLKSERKMQLLQNGQVLKTYRIALGQNATGHKTQEGDERTPEGRYTLDFRNPRSIAHRALHISYPNAADKAQAKARGVSPGGAVMVHGLPNKVSWIGPLHRLMDWTDGCIGVTNAEMDEIWRAVPVGTPIEIRP
jgi:murein L,D-transpeptidase YafK